MIYSNYLNTHRSASVYIYAREEIFDADETFRAAGEHRQFGLVCAIFIPCRQPPGRPNILRSSVAIARGGVLRVVIVSRGILAL